MLSQTCFSLGRAKLTCWWYKPRHERWKKSAHWTLRFRVIGYSFHTWKKTTFIAVLKEHQNTVYFLADSNSNQSCPQQHLKLKRTKERGRERERKEGRKRKENKPSSRFTALEWEGSKYKILAEFCRVSAEVYTLTIRALLKMGGKKEKSAGREKREGSNLISSALKGRVLAPVSDSPR